MVGGVARNKVLYGFTYDNLNRLTNAKYGEHTGSGYTNFDRYNETLTYNLSGDILSLARQGYTGSGYAQIDALAYSYASSGTFRLTSMTETSDKTKGFTINAGQTVSSYTYDNNGNISGRTNVGYGTITYNHLNLPHTITGAGGTVSNTYDAAGRKWTAATAGVVTTYFSGIEYEGNALKAIYLDDGRIEKLAGGTFEYQYYIKDHLGNIRVLFKSGPTLMQEYHYYPFGLEQGGTWVAPLGLTQKYRYNGKELVGSGLAWYDYGARWYDPSLGRFISVDPMASNFLSWSPYHYVYNSPLRYTDPTGMSANDIIIRGSYQNTFNWTVGSTYDGDDIFIQQTVEALNALSSDPNTANFSFKGIKASGVNFEGNAVLDYASGGSKDDQDVFIEHADNNPAAPGENQHITGTVYWDPSRGIAEEGFNGAEGSGAFPSMGMLIHEMGHAALYNEFGGADWQDRKHIFADEEKMIIDRLEKTAMQSLGFGYRTDHGTASSRSDLINAFPGAKETGRPFRGSYYIPSLTPTQLKK